MTSIDPECGCYACVECGTVCCHIAYCANQSAEIDVETHVDTRMCPDCYRVLVLASPHGASNV